MQQIRFNDTKCVNTINKSIEEYGKENNCKTNVVYNKNREMVIEIVKNDKQFKFPLNQEQINANSRFFKHFKDYLERYLAYKIKIKLNEKDYKMLKTT